MKRAGRGTGNKKVTRVNMSLDNKDSFKLERLAIACNTKPTTLANLILHRALNDPILIKELQDEFCLHSAYRILPIRNYNANEIDYMLEVNNMREDI